jgi:hypothetical protein
VILIMMKGENESKKNWANGEVLHLITKRNGI